MIREMPAEVSQRSSDSLQKFARGESIAERWIAARELMARREIPKAKDSDDFSAGWQAVVSGVSASEGIARLLHVDLLVRLSSFVKQLKTSAHSALTNALQHPLPDLDLVTDTRLLPADAKSAEIRENIAIALSLAQGEWVLSYVFESLASEDKSQRARVELVKRLAERSSLVDDWLEGLIQQPPLRRFVQNVDPDNAAARLRDIASSLADGVRNYRTRLSATEAAGLKLANLCRLMVSTNPQRKIPRKLEGAAVEVSRLLDEVLGVRLSLIAEPEAYAVLAILRNWWQPLPYPKQLVAALDPIVAKLVSAIALRGRMGQRSDSLASRLGGTGKFSGRKVDSQECF
jgi:hypothetical protein